MAATLYVKASNTGASDEFGYSVSLDGDTLVVGASDEDSDRTGVNSSTADNDDASNSGAVFVFTRTGTTWSQQAYIKASNTGSDDYFGYSVSLDGDTLAVGAFEDSDRTGVNSSTADNDDASNSGAVYVFTRTGTTWSQQAHIKASNTEANDRFGWFVSVNGDTLAVGARSEDSDHTGVNPTGDNNNTSNSGAVYVFARTGTTWSQQAYIKASNTGEDDEFGYSVSVDGDTLAVGAYREDSDRTGVNSSTADNDDASNSGAVYVFTRTGTTWSQQAYIKASNTEANDRFGWSVSVNGDTLAVGAYREDNSATGVNPRTADNDDASNSGAVYVFTRTGTTWSQQAYIKASNTGEDDGFGYSVSLDGDTLAVGATDEDSDGTGVNPSTPDNSDASNSGAVYVFTRTGTTWSEQAYIKASNTGLGDTFGSSVSVDGDTLVVAAPYEESDGTGVNPSTGDNDNASDSGAVYVY